MKKLGIVLVTFLAFITGMTVGSRARNGSFSSSSQQHLSKGDIDNMVVSLSNWGRWGTNDELGTMNLITPEKRKQAAALVQDGVSISLAREVIPSHDGGSDSFQQKMISTGESANSNHASDVYSTNYHGSTVTHLDALCHIFYRGKMYNGIPQAAVTENGATRLSVINMKNGIFTRAVLLDMPRFWGVKYLEGTKAIYPKDLEAWENQSGVKVERGDAVLIRTGRWARQEVEGAAAVEKVAAGLDASCLAWLRQRGVAIVGSDLATDLIPSGIEGFEAPIHLVVINIMGMPILDNCNFDSLSEYASAHKRWSFLLTAAPLSVRGGTGSPINPVATF
jgi:kynurenine formamidase